MEQNNKIKKGASKYIIMVMIQRIIGIIMYFIAAGTLSDYRGITNILLYFILTIVASIIMFRNNKETLNERGKKQENTKKWDKIILPFFVVISCYVIYIVAGLGSRFNWEKLPLFCFYIGILFYIVSCVFMLLPILENKHFESTSRIQDNRKHSVVNTGPYKIIRHPGYLGIIMWSISCVLIFGTLYVSIICFIIILLIWVRTYLEDKMLKNELEGYMEYTKEVKYRLIPYIW